jgi:pyridoxine 4-dehydrogenase
MMPRFSKENFGKNLELVKDLQRVAKSKGCTPAQLAIGWVSHLSLKDGNPEIIPIPGATTEARVLENSRVITLSSSELAEIDVILKSFTVAGDRYGGPQKVRFQ